MDLALRGLTVLVTGASGGIGRATAEAFARCGANLALHARTRTADLDAWLRGRDFAHRAATFSADLRDPAATRAAFGEASDRFGRLDACIVNAGIWPEADTPLHEQDEARIRDVIETNLLGAIFSAQSFLEALARSGPRDDDRGATLCFVGSTAGRFGEPGHAEYAASKAALRGLVRSLKTEITRLDSRGRVNMVEPGWTRTSMAERGLAAPGSVERVISTTSLPQLARPDDVAGAIVALSSPGLSRHVTGEILTVSGGLEGRLLRPPDQIDRRAVLDRS